MLRSYAVSASCSPDNVYMEFLGPVPGVLRGRTGHYVVFWVQAAGGAGFTRPSQEERDYYKLCGKPVPEWQCEYFDFNGLAWSEPALTVDLCLGATKLRSLCLPAREGRTVAEVLKELPEVAGFIRAHGMSSDGVAPSFHDALLNAAGEVGIIERRLPVVPARDKFPVEGPAGHPWWLRVARRLSRRWAA